MIKAWNSPSLLIAATALAENSLAMRTTSRGEGPLAVFSGWMELIQKALLMGCDWDVNGILIPKGAIETYRNYDSRWTCMMQTSYSPPTISMEYPVLLRTWQLWTFPFTCSTDRQHGFAINGRLWLANTDCQIHPLRVSPLYPLISDYHYHSGTNWYPLVLLFDGKT